MTSEVKTNTISESSSGSGVTIDGVKLKDSGIESSSGSRVLASDSGSAWSWGSGLPSGSIVQVQSTQYGTSSSESAEISSIVANTNYVLQNSSSPTTGGDVSGILDVNITPIITGSKIWLQTHVFGELYDDDAHNCVFFFWRKVSGGATSKLASGISGTLADGDKGITSPTRSFHGSDADSSPEIVNMQYFDTHGVSSGTQITYKVGLAVSQSTSTKWTTNKCISLNNNEVGVSSICAIELAP